MLMNNGDMEVVKVSRYINYQESRYFIIVESGSFKGKGLLPFIYTTLRSSIIGGTAGVESVLSCQHRDLCSHRIPLPIIKHLVQVPVLNARYTMLETLNALCLQFMN